MIFEGIYRRFGSQSTGKDAVDVRFTRAESLAVAQVEPSGAELTRSGRRIVLGRSAATTGIAPVQILPTTAAQWLIWNNDITRTCFFETIGVYMTSGTPGVGGILLAAIVSAPAQVGANTGGLLETSMSGGNILSKIVVKSGVTITAPTAPTWFPIAENNSPNVGAFPGSATMVNRNVAGRIAIQPGRGLALVVLAPTGTTPLWAPFGEWVEVETDME